MTTSSARSRGAILILLVAFCLTITLWVSHERAMTMKPEVKPLPEHLASRKLQGHDVDEHYYRVRANVRNVQIVHDRITPDGLADEQPFFRSPSHYTTAGVSLSRGGSISPGSIALVDLKEITLAYHKQTGTLPTNSPAEWSNYIQSIQLIVSNRAVADGYALVLSKTAYSANTTPIYFITGEVADITPAVIKDLYALKTHAASIP
jgi:hypothetical protein